MSEERTPMAPAVGLVKGRLDALPPVRRSPKPARQSSGPVLVEPLADVDPSPATEQEAEKAVPSAAKATGDAKPKKATARPKTSSATGGMKRTTLSLPQELVDQLAERRKNTPKISQVQFILNSLATTRNRLKDLIAADNDGAEGNDLFPIASTTRAAVDKRTTISFDTAEENMKIIDALVESSGAISRSQLVRVALADVLGA